MTTQLEAPRLSSLDARRSTQHTQRRSSEEFRRDCAVVSQDLIFATILAVDVTALGASRALSQIDIKTYSAGTETTAFNPRAVKALKTHGFQIDESNKVLDGGNIVYDVDFPT